MKPDYDTTVARIAGNIIGHLVQRTHAPGNDGFVGVIPDEVTVYNVRAAVAAARAIVAEVKRTESPTPPRKEA